MPNPLIRKLAHCEAFTAEDRAVLERLCDRAQPVEARQDIIRAGERPSDVHLVLDGFACRYKLMPEGKRQIVALFVPGDFCDLHVAILGRMDHFIGTLTPCTIVDIPAAIIHELTQNHPRINRALWWATLVDEGIMREWLAGLGQRVAIKRMAHFFCEMLVRLQIVGRSDGGSFALPLTQTDLGDLLGLTSIHVNRTLQDLKGQGLIILERKKLTIPDVNRLKTFCDFDPTYLHLEARQPSALV